MARARPWLMIAAGAILLLIPCLIAGRPQVFTDTKAYYALGQQIAGLLPAAPQHSATETLRGHALKGNDAARQVRLAYTVAAARSPYYSAYLYLLCWIGTAWLVVAVQALGGAAVIWLAVRAFALERSYLPIMAVLAFATSLPIFTFFVMPDFATALALLAAMVLLTRWQALARGGRAAFAAVILVAALFHTANALLFVALGLAFAALGLLARGRAGAFVPGAVAVAACAVAGWAGLLAYPAAVHATRHERIYAPPFVAARLIADGPGRRLLRERCGHGLASSWCRFARQPLADNNQILWDKRPATGAFQLAGYDERVRLIEEQPAFVREVVATYPAEVAGSAAANTLALLFNYRVREVLEDNPQVWTDPSFAVFAKIVPGTQRCATERLACDVRLPWQWVNPLLGIVVVMAAIGLLLLLATDARLRAAWGRPLLVLATGLVLNAAICGVISGDAERYQARLLWLVPFLAMCATADRLRRRSAAPAGTGSEARRGTAPPYHRGGNAQPSLGTSG